MLELQRRIREMESLTPQNRQQRQQQTVLSAPVETEQPNPEPNDPDPSFKSSNGHLGHGPDGSVSN